MQRVPLHTHILPLPSVSAISYSYNLQIINLEHLCMVYTASVPSLENNDFPELFNIDLAACDVGELSVNGGS